MDGICINQPLSKDELNLIQTDPFEAVLRYRDRTGTSLKTSKCAIENAIGRKLGEYVKSLHIPSVTNDEILYGLNVSYIKALDHYKDRTGLDSMSAQKEFNSALDKLKAELLEKANLFKGGDNDLDLDHSDFWLWQYKVSSLDFVADIGDNIKCLSPLDLWYMDQNSAKKITFTDVIGGGCIECKYHDRCKPNRPL